MIINQTAQKVNAGAKKQNCKFFCFVAKSTEMVG
jgi:hypothetical protein